MTPRPSVDILVVDDNVNNLQSMEAVLGELGANLVKAHSGEEALRLLLGRDFALILLDIQMPNLDGFETAALIRSRDRTRHIPIIFVTAYDRNEQAVVTGYQLGAVDFLFKPIVPEILRAKVSVFLQLHRKTQETLQQTELLRRAQEREHERGLAETRREFERSLMQQEVERERRVADALAQRAQELARLAEEREEAQRETARSNLRLGLLASTAHRLLVAQAPGELLQELFGRVSAHVGLPIFVHSIFDEPSAALTLSVQQGLSPDEVAAFTRQALGEGICGRAGSERRPVLVEDARRPGEWEDPALQLTGLASFACYPLLVQGRLLGTLLFGSRKPTAFTPDELSLLEGLSDQVAAWLDRDRLISELREADRRKDDFLAMLAHELRNPLAPIRNALEVVRLRGSPEEKVLARALDAADRQVLHMTRLVDDLLDVSRITRGKVELRRLPLEVATLVEHAVQANEPILQQRRHALSVKVPPQAGRVLADPTRITQVFGNLLHNAAKYTDPGGEISVSTESAGGEIVVRFRDNGIGIRAEMLPRVFEAFVQVDSTSDRAQGGLGLGLTLVRRLVEMHGGTVSAHSQGPGRGSEFVVRLPLLGGDEGLSSLTEELPRAPGAAPLRQGTNPLARHAPLSILLVEDNEDIRTTLRDLLELHGHLVAEAADGVRAVELVLGQKPQVALVDIGLPGLDGYRVAELVRAAAGGGAHTRLVALTGYGGAEDRRRALAAGFDAHLVKPISSEDLSHVLDELL